MEFEPPVSSRGRPRSNTTFPSSPFTPTTNDVFTGFTRRTASVRYSSVKTADGVSLDCFVFILKVAEPTPTTPTIAPRTLNLYIVAEDCAPPKEGEGIMYIHKGQIFDVIDNSSDWWLARLVRDVMPNKHTLCEQGWVPGSFLDRYSGQLDKTEEALIQAGMMTWCDSLNSS